MHLNLPEDIKAEIVDNYIEGIRKEYVFLGNHKRNAYEDILSVTHEGNAVRIELSRQGLYDILPEALFHPVNRFDNLPANEYEERFAEEVERQRIEEANARSFFALYDKFIFDLNSLLARFKDEDYGDNRVLYDIICDTLPHRYKSNRFVIRAKEFTPRCRSIRGNLTLLTFMLRKVMTDEGLKLTENNSPMAFRDETPRYSCRIQDDGESTELYMGNQYEESVLCYDVHYWDDDFCDESFLKFIDEIKVFEDFVNDYFMGIETVVRFDISTKTLPVRLSDELCYNYLNYNTNL